MNEFLSNRINSLAESETLAMMRMSRELMAKGHDVISLAVGEPDFNTPEDIKVAAIQAINDNFTHYTPVSGIPELRQAVCRKLKRDNGLDYKPENIVGFDIVTAKGGQVKTIDFIDGFSTSAIESKIKNS